MKVLHLIGGGDTGGAKTHVLSLLGELKKTEDVRLVCLREGVMSREAEALGIPVTVLSGGFFAEKRAVRALLREGYELLHCHGSRANLTGALLKGSLSCPVISTVHSDPRLDYLGRPWAALFYGTANRLALHRMDAIVCVSRAMRETVHRLGHPYRRLFTLYNGIPLQIQPEKRGKDALFAALGLPAEEDALYIGCAARLEAVKDHSTLLRGFAAATQDEPRLRLLLAGDGTERERLKTLARKLGIGDRVFFLGHVKDMSAFYGLLDINILPSLSETFPYALTEGALRGIPAAASEAGGIPELIRDGMTGLLFPPGSAERLGAVLKRLCSDAALRQRLGAALRETVEKNHSIEAMGRRQRDIYRTVLSPRGSVVIAGACGQGNPGDEAMLRVMLERIRSVSPDMPVTVLSHAPGKTAAAFQADSVWYLALLRIRRELKRASLLLCGGGNLLQDVTSRRSLRYYLALLRWGHRWTGQVMLFGAGIGPLRKKGLEKTVNTLNEAADILVLREGDSLRLLLKNGVTGPRMILSADPALTYPEEAIPDRLTLREKYPLAENAVLLCLRRHPGMEQKARLLVSSAARWAAETGREVFLLPLAREDERFCAAVRGTLPLLPCPETEGEAVGVISLGCAVLSARLHGLVFARRAGIPAAGIACDGRIPTFLGKDGLWRDYASCTDTTAAELLSAALAQGGREITKNEREALQSGFCILDREVRACGEKEKNSHSVRRYRL